MEENKKQVNWSDPKIKQEVFIEQRRKMWSEEQIEHFASKFKLKPGLKLLDAGCGFGYILLKFGRFVLPGGRLYGIELDENLLREAAQLAAENQVDRFCDLRQGDICHLDLEDDTFDACISQLVLSHIKDPELALREMIRVTKPGGCIAVLDNATNDFSVIEWTNVLDFTLEEALFECEINWRLKAGRKKLDRFARDVAHYVPGWMEKYHLTDIDARCNEYINWIAPPYRSPSQKNDYNSAMVLTHNEDPFIDYLVEFLKAGGAGPEMIEKYKQNSQERRRKIRDALDAGTCAISSSMGSFWCIWGFKS